MGKVISFIDYKKSKKEKLNLDCNSQYKNKYEEALEKLTEEDYRIIQELLENN